MALEEGTLARVFRQILPFTSNFLKGQLSSPEDFRPDSVNGNVGRMWEGNSSFRPSESRTFSLTGPSFVWW